MIERDREAVDVDCSVGGAKMLTVGVILAVTLTATCATNTGSGQPVGIGAYAYQDSTGKRYAGKFDIGEDDIPNFAQYAPGFSGTGFFGGFPQGFPFAGGADFVPEFFKNLQSSLEDHIRQHSSARAVISFGGAPARIRQRYSAFPGNQANQHAAFNSVNMAFHNTFGQGGAGGSNPFESMAQQYSTGIQDLGDYQHPQGGNSAYAGGAIGPQGTRQVASISPANPNQPNVDVSSRSGGGDGGFYSVSSSSFAHSSDVDGRKSESRGAKTIVNDNGRVKQYEVRS